MNGMQFEPEVFSFTARLDGRVNFRPIGLTGEGRILRGKGITEGQYEISALPRGFDPLLFSILTITGYPHASKCIGSAQNVFAGRTYEYQRTISFCDGGELLFRARCIRNDDHIDSQFFVTGGVDVPDLASFEPLVEKWIPQGPGRVYGHFTPSWLTSDGQRVIAEATTRYFIETDEELERPQHRFITIKTATAGNRIAKHQNVTLWREMPDHDEGDTPTLAS